MIFLCTSRFDLEEQEAKRLEEFFTQDEIEVAKEEKDKRPDGVEVDLISDTEELDKGDKENKAVEDIEDDMIEPKLPDNGTQLRLSGRKRKQRDDDNFQYH